MALRILTRENTVNYRTRTNHQNATFCIVLLYYVNRTRRVLYFILQQQNMNITVTRRYFELLGTVRSDGRSYNVIEFCALLCLYGNLVIIRARWEGEGSGARLSVFVLYVHITSHMQSYYMEIPNVIILCEQLLSARAINFDYRYL